MEPGPNSLAPDTVLTMCPECTKHIGKPLVKLGD